MEETEQNHEVSIDESLIAKQNELLKQAIEMKDAFSEEETEEEDIEPEQEETREINSIPLEQIPPWSEFASEALDGTPEPNPEEFLYPINEEINQLISYIPGGDSTSLKIDAIVNAANSELYAGGGICGVIHSRAGPKLEQACEKIGHCESGDAVVTPGFNLPAKYVIHAVGPIGEQPKILQSAYEKTLELIDGEKIRSVGLCCISTGIYGYPIRPATQLALDVVRKFLENVENRKKVDRIIFVVFLSKDCKIYDYYLPRYFPLPDGVVKYQVVESESEEDAEPKTFKIDEK